MNKTERDVWRTKQSLDYVFLWSYIWQTKAEYFLQLEDDIIASPKSSEFITKQIEQAKRSNWFMLEFSSLGFIGKLFKRDNLMQLITYTLLFFESMPVDLILGQFLRTKYCQPTDSNDICNEKIENVRMKFIPSQFRHVGDISSLPDKIQKANDPGMKRANPSAVTRINNVHHTEFQIFYSKRKGEVKIENFQSLELRFSHLSCFEKVSHFSQMYLKFGGLCLSHNHRLMKKLSIKVVILLNYVIDTIKVN